MSIWSRISDFAHNLGDSIIHAIESYWQKTPPEKTVVFTIAMIALSAKIAKADGVVTDDERIAFAQVFQVPEKDRAAVERVFNTAKQDIAGFEAYASQVAKLFGPKSHVLETVVNGLFHIAKADRVLHPSELEFLKRVAEIFGFAGPDWQRILAHHAMIKDDPYEALGVSRDMPFAEIKKKYRTLVKELHPDKQIAAGVPEELVRLATERLAKVNAAFAAIEKAQGK